MTFGNNPVNGGVRDGFLEREPLHLGFGGGNENVQVAVDERIFAGFVVARGETHSSAIFQERIPQQSIDPFDGVGVDERLRPDVLADHGQPGAMAAAWREHAMESIRAKTSGDSRS